MEYTAVIGGTQYTGTYTGTIEKKVPNGAGKFTGTADDASLTYEGTWENGAPVGSCTMETNNCSVTILDTGYVGTYAGEAADGLPEGNGKFTFSDENTSLEYDGAWIGGEPNGAGSLRFTDASEYMNYDGAWANGSYSGEGRLETDAYTVHFVGGPDRVGSYSGDVLNGIAEGTGTFTAVNDEGQEYTYEGSWKDGLYDGEGTRTFKDSSWVYRGHYEKGEFAPTPEQFFAALGSGHNFELSDNAAEFLNAHPQIFLNSSIGEEEVEFEENFKFEAFSKNDAKYGSKLVTLKNLRIVQIYEYEDLLGHNATFFIADDSNYRPYYCYMFGYADDIYEKTRVTMTALPVDYMSYENTYGNTVYAIACAVVSITK